MVCAHLKEVVCQECSTGGWVEISKTSQIPDHTHPNTSLPLYQGLTEDPEISNLRKEVEKLRGIVEALQKLLSENAD
jgi:hypothetical protein